MDNDVFRAPAESQRDWLLRLCGELSDIPVEVIPVVKENRVSLVDRMSFGFSYQEAA